VKYKVFSSYLGVPDILFFIRLLYVCYVIRLFYLKQAIKKQKPSQRTVFGYGESWIGSPFAIAQSFHYAYQLWRTAILSSVFRLCFAGSNPVEQFKSKKTTLTGGFFYFWLRGQDLNLRPSGYEPIISEIP
jgi:hypothetical protein